MRRVLTRPSDRERVKMNTFKELLLQEIKSLEADKQEYRAEYPNAGADGYIMSLVGQIDGLKTAIRLLGA